MKKSGEDRLKQAINESTLSTANAVPLPQKIAARRGANRASVAVAHSMLIAIYHILKSGERFKDLGEDYYNQFNKEKKKKYYLKKLTKLGVNLKEATLSISIQAAT